MPKMLELPPLPLEAIAAREPVLRLRHAITNTNYYVQIFAESAPGVDPLKLEAADFGDIESDAGNPDEPAAPADPSPPSSVQTPAAKTASPAQSAAHDARRRQIYAELFGENLDDLHDATPDEDARLTAPQGALLAQVPARDADMEWASTTRLRFLPLTGLTRKTLQRLGVMGVPRIDLG
jgi:A/G-specific adenine glycosylase